MKREAYEYYGLLDPGHHLIHEPGLVSCVCGDFWLQAQDDCAESDPHYGLWEAWSMNRLMEETDPDENVQLLEALDSYFGVPTSPSVWDV